MILTDEEKQMRDGAEGAATAAAMDLLIRYGDALACDRLCDVRNVAGTMTQPSPVKERLVREGGWDKAFAVINLDCDTDIEVDQVRRAAAALEGRRLSPGAELWLMLPRALRDVADRSGYTEVIERAGGRLLGDSCPAMSRVAPEGTRVFATDSAKQAHYLPAILGIEAWFGTLEDCVDAAVTGRWHGALEPRDPP